MMNPTFTETDFEKAERCISLLFRVLAQANGDVAILHAGERPYLVGRGGRRPLAHDDLSVAGMRRLIRQLLPEEERNALARIGATRYELPTLPDRPDEHFTIDAKLAQGGPLVEVRMEANDAFWQPLPDRASLRPFGPR